MSAVMDNLTFMNVKQVAEYLHLNEKKIYSLVGEGEIPATKVTGKWMFPRELVDRWMLDSAHGGLLSDRLIISGSDDPLLHRVLVKLAHEMGNRALVCYTPTGTRQGLDLLQSHRADAAAIHWGPDTESATRHPALVSQYPQHRSWIMIHAFRREQGLIVSPAAFARIEQAQDLLSPGFNWAVRQSGSGAQRYLMETLAKRGTSLDDLNPVSVAFSEREAAATIRMGVADTAPGARATASEFGLEFLPLGWESFDLVLPKSIWFRHLFQSVLKAFKSVECLHVAESLTGYDLDKSGELVWGQH